MSSVESHIAIAVTAPGVVEAISVPTLNPGAHDLLVKVEYASLMAFDVYQVEKNYFVPSYPNILGLNAAGTVSKIGSDVQGFSVGDRVTVFGFTGREGGKTMQQYGLFPAHLVSKIPDSLDMQSAATYPDTFATAFYALFGSDTIGLPIPQTLPVTVAPPDAQSPILIYGSGTTVGAFAIQSLKLAGYKNIITTASKKHHGTLSKYGATHVFDYKSSTLVEDILKGSEKKIPFVVDCVSTLDSLAVEAKVIAKGGKLIIITPIKDGPGLMDGNLMTQLPAEISPFGADIKPSYLMVLMYQNDPALRDILIPKVLGSLLASGLLAPSTVRLLDNEHGDFKQRVLKGLELLRTGQINGEKIVVKIDH